MIQIKYPYDKETLKSLRAGDRVLISGTIYTARDAAHKRMIEMLKAGQQLPFEVAGSIIYYAGPTPAKEGMPIGSAGPTTSYRMDAYAPTLLDLGLAGMIGKGPRSQEVKDATVRNGAVYFAATGGAGALIARSVVSSEVIAFEDLGAEAVRKLEVVDFPAVVVNDSVGGDLYISGPKAYLESRKGA